MGLPLLLPLLGAVGAAGVGAARGKARREQGEQAASDIMTLMGQTGPQAGMDPTQQQAAFSALSGQDPLARQVALQAMTPPDPMVNLKLEKAALENQQLQLENAALANPQAQTDPSFVAKQADTLFQRRRADLLPYANNLQNFRELTSLLNQESGPAAMGATFKFISGLDDSVVRDSESRMLMGGSGIANQLVSLYNRAVGEGFISDEIARDIYQAALAVAEQQQASAREVQQRHDARIANYAEQFMAPQLPSLVGQPIQFRNQPLPALTREINEGGQGDLPTGQSMDTDEGTFEVLD